MTIPTTDTTRSEADLRINFATTAIFDLPQGVLTLGRLAYKSSDNCLPGLELFPELRNDGIINAEKRSNFSDGLYCFNASAARQLSHCSIRPLEAIQNT